MSQLQIFIVDWQLVKKNAGGAAGPTYAYRRDHRRAIISAASGSAGDILAVLNADIPVGAGEVIEILAVNPGPNTGTEGAVLA